jgi:hypothetical protein
VFATPQHSSSHAAWHPAHLRTGRAERLMTASSARLEPLATPTLTFPAAFFACGVSFSWDPFAGATMAVDLQGRHTRGKDEHD